MATDIVVEGSSERMPNPNVGLFGRIRISNVRSDAHGQPIHKSVIAVGAAYPIAQILLQRSKTVGAKNPDDVLQTVQRMLTRYRYLWVVLPLLVWSCTPARQPPQVLPTTGSKITVAATPPAPDAADYPPYDFDVFRRLTEGLARKATTARLARDPNDPGIIRDLLTQERAEEALLVLRRIVSAFPDRMPSAFEATYGQGTRFSSRAHGQPEALQEIVNAAKQQLPRLSHENAARVARQLLLLNRQRTCPGENTTENSLRCFLDEYADTETGLLTQVDVIEFQGKPLSDRLAALDQLVREHPGTVVAAKALAQKAFQLSSGNVYAGRPSFEQRDADPTPRLLQVIDIIHELESGRYPPCEWITRARTYASGFFVDQARFAPDNIDRLVEAYFRYVVTHFTLDPMSPGRYGIGGIIGGSIPRLLERKGVNSDIEPLLDRLEREAPDRAAAQYLRAAIYVEWLLRGERPINRPEVYEKAVSTLQTLQAEGNGAVNGRALATLASLYFSEREYTRARDTFSQYLSRYPTTTWAWLATLRLGQSEEALGEWDAAARAYSAAATTHADVPFARVLGHAYAAAIWQRLNEFDRALTEQQAALSGWDADYGLTYAVYEIHPRRPGDDGGASPFRSIARDTLTDETERLEQSLQQRGGSLVERGRWLILHGAFREALDPLRRALAGGSARSLSSDAHYWEHRALVGLALQLAAADNPTPNADGALKQLESAATGSYDFGVFMAETAKASILWQKGSSTEAASAMGAAIERWDVTQRDARERPRTDLTEDVAAIRELILHPRGGTVLSGFVANTVRDQQSSRSVMVVDPEVHLRLPQGETRPLTVYQPFSGTEHVLFLTTDQRNSLAGIIATLDGRPNQPGSNTSGRAVASGNRRAPLVRPLWDHFFPTPEWNQTFGQTAPTITDIEFLNAERTKAAVRIQARNQGGTVMFEKVDGIWRVVDLVDSWIS
jgi:tetratricopeptide (TPR) repeat protein